MRIRGCLKPIKYFPAIKRASLSINNLCGVASFLDVLVDDTDCVFERDEHNNFVRRLLQNFVEYV